MRYLLHHYSATLIKVVDGDSVRLSVDCGFHQRREDLYRLNGINSPETRGDQKTDGLEATAYLQQLLDGCELIVQTHKPEKFGRWLVTIFALRNGAWVNVNQAMIDGGHAVSYHGEKR